ncbi:MAG: spore germination protein [Clostridia bacterium]|nr:spore germination protein [Clostridia bacterium]
MQVASPLPPPDSNGVIDYNVIKISADIQENYKIFKEIFKNDNTVVIRVFENQQDKDIQFLGISINGMVKPNSIYQSITSPLMQKKFDKNESYFTQAHREIISSLDLSIKTDVKDIVKAILYGDTAIMVSGGTQAILVETKGWSTRSISEPDSEKNLKGPREGFTEAMIINASLIRRRIQTSDLKFQYMNLGTRTNTFACIVYLDSLVDKKVLTEFVRRLEKISSDSVLDANYIEELIKDNRHSPFKTIGSTEKPDVAAARILEGRIALIVDGTPIVITLPYLFIENFQSPDDYYLNYYFASIGRLLRIIGFFITISLPSVYLALVTYHQEMLPTQMVTAIAESSKGVPFPTFVECLIMLFVFEILRETGIRMSSKIGQALGIVGGLVVGQAAVEAKIVSAPMVIVIAFTGITGLITPRLSGAAILIRTLSLIFTAILGFYGFFLFMITVLIHVMSLKSFSYEYISLSFKPQSIKDIYVRAPQWQLKTRPKFAKDKYRR